MFKNIDLFVKRNRNAILRLAFLAVSFFAFVVVDTIVLHPDRADFSIAHYLGMFVRAGIYVCLLLAPAFLLRNKSRWFYVPFFTYRYLLFVVTLFVFLKFKLKLDGDWLLIVGTSSWNETFQFLRPFCSVVGFASVITVCLVWFLAVRSIGQGGFVMRGRKGLVIAAALVLPFAVCVWHSGQCVEEFVRATVGMIGWDTHLKANMSAKLNQICANPELPRKVERQYAEIPKTVFVIGESATRRHWHLYGYPQKTTDVMDSLRSELVVFQNVNAAASTTFPALRLLMTCASVEHPDDFKYTFSSVAKRAEFHTAFYTMCQRWGRGVGSVSVLFNGCDEIVHLDEALGAEFKGYDGELLPYLRKGLEKSDLLFLHTVGSHYPFGCHVPADYAKSKFSASKTEAYDRSIDYTDWFLGEVIVELKKSTGPTMMIYLSDHGETPEATSWRDVTDPSCWEVPMIVWFSESYRRKFPENVALAEKAAGKPLRSDELLHGLLRLCGIRPMSEELDFLSERFVTGRITGGIRGNPN